MVRAVCRLFLHFNHVSSSTRIKAEKYLLTGILIADVEKLVHCIRSRTWIAPPSKAVRYCHQHTIGSTNLFSEEWMKMLAENPEKYKMFLDEIDNMAREERFRTVSITPLRKKKTSTDDF